MEKAVGCCGPLAPLDSIPLTGPVLRDFAPYTGISVNHPVKAPVLREFWQKCPKNALN